MERTPADDRLAARLAAELAALEQPAASLWAYVPPEYEPSAALATELFCVLGTARYANAGGAPLTTAAVQQAYGHTARVFADTDALAGWLRAAPPAELAEPYRMPDFCRVGDGRAAVLTQQSCIAAPGHYAIFRPNDVISGRVSCWLCPAPRAQHDGLEALVRQGVLSAAVARELTGRPEGTTLAFAAPGSVEALCSCQKHAVQPYSNAGGRAAE